MQIAYSAKYPQLFCVVLLLCIVRNAAVDLFICNSNNNTNAKFENNLNIVLNNLVNNASSSNGLSTSLFGESPYRVYGLLQCYGGATVEECLSCSQKANNSIRQLCGNALGGRTWRSKCFIRYESYSFIGILDTNARIVYNTGKVTDEPDVFSMAVKALFTNLSDEALRDLLDVTVTNNGTFRGGMAGSGSWVARYETYSFFNTAPPPPPPPPQLLSPPPIQQPPSSPPTLKKSSNKTVIYLGIAGGLLVMLLLCLFAIRRKIKSVVLWKPALLRKENLDTEVNSATGQEHEIIFNLENIKAATRNSHDDNKGGFGAVYKVT